MPEILDPQQVARNQPPSRGDVGLLGEAPALNDPEWLPQGSDIEELDELRDEHERLHGAAVEIGRAVADVERRHEGEDARHAEALKAEAAGQKVKVPELTPPEERAAELAPLKARARASAEVREEFAVRAVETIAEGYDEWASELNERDAEAEFQVEKLRRALAEAEAEVGATLQLRHWLARTAGHSRFRELPARHIQFAALAGAGRAGTYTATAEGSTDE